MASLFSINHGSWQTPSGLRITIPKNARRPSDAASVIRIDVNNSK